MLQCSAVVQQEISLLKFLFLKKLMCNNVHPKFCIFIGYVIKSFSEIALVSLNMLKPAQLIFSLSEMIFLRFQNFFKS